MRGSLEQDALDLPAVAATQVRCIKFQLTLFPAQTWRSPQGVVLIEMNRPPRIDDDLSELMAEELSKARLGARIYLELFVLLGDPGHGRLITSVPQVMLDDRRDPRTAAQIVEMLLAEIARGINARYLTFA